MQGVVCAMPVEHFPAKWAPVRRRKCDQTRAEGIFRRSGHRFAAENATKQEPRAFSGEVGTGSPQKIRQYKYSAHLLGWKDRTAL